MYIYIYILYYYMLFIFIYIYIYINPHDQITPLVLQIRTWNLGSRMVSFQKTQGKMIIDPRPSFQAVWLNQKCWYLKNAQKDVRMQKGCRRMAKRLSLLIAGHQSAPGGLEWLPSGLKSTLTRIDLGKVVIDPRPSLQADWWNKECAEGCRM